MDIIILAIIFGGVAGWAIAWWRIPPAPEQEPDAAPIAPAKQILAEMIGGPLDGDRIIIDDHVNRIHSKDSTGQPIVYLRQPHVRLDEGERLIFKAAKHHIS